MFDLKKHKKSILIISTLIILNILINIIVSSIIKKKITEALLNSNSITHTVSVDKVSFKLLARSITINDISYVPTEKIISDLKSKSASKNELQKIEISSIKLKGIGLVKAIFNKNININSIHINDPIFEKISNPNMIEKKEPKGNSFDLDSIYIENLKGLQIDNIKFENLTYKVSDVSSNDITFQTSPISFNTGGFKLENIEKHIFKLRSIDDEFNLEKLSIDLGEKKYLLSVGGVSVDLKKKLINIKKLGFKPTIDKNTLAKSYKYTQEVFNVEIEDLNIYNFDLSKALKNNGVFIDSITLIGMDLNIYKDKNKPFDLNKRPVLLNYKLKQMKLPLLIHKINIINGRLKYEERQEKRDLLMTVSLDHLKASIHNMTSIRAHRENPLTIDLEAKLMNKGKMDVHINFPLKDDQNTFYFNGNLASSKLEYYDSAIYPALGLKILQGEVDKLTFNASATNISSHGSMTFLYHDLKAKVFKSDSKEKSKFLSWGINTALHVSNPGKNDKVREVQMNFDRVNYKGLGNYLWKTVQSGLVNTMAPIGKKTDESKERSKKDRKESKKEKQEERVEHREEKKNDK